jgi:hypothetical protein
LGDSVTTTCNALAGESNLKVRRPLNIKGRSPETPEAAAAMSVTLACEPPNNNLHYFIGRAVVQVTLLVASVNSSHNRLLRCSTCPALEVSTDGT